MAQNRLLLLPEVAERMRLTQQGLRWQIHTKKAPPSAIIAGRRVWDEAQLEKWLAEQFEKSA